MVSYLFCFIVRIEGVTESSTRNIYTVYKAEECGRRRVTRNSFRVTQKETKQRNLMTYKKTSYQDSINKDLKIVSSILQCKNSFLKTSYLDT